mgnify:CR=1 FL=1
MKKILVLFVLSIACIMGTHAQEGLKWGAMAGMNSSKFSTDGLDSKVGFHVGIKARKTCPDSPRCLSRHGCTAVLKRYTNKWE